MVTGIPPLLRWLQRFRYDAANAASASGDGVGDDGVGTAAAIGSSGSGVDPTPRSSQVLVLGAGK